jgi:hypothetical protein
MGNIPERVKTMNKTIILMILLMFFLTSTVIAKENKHIEPITYFGIYDIHIDSNNNLVWKTTHPATSSAEIYYFDEPEKNNLASRCSKTHSQPLDTETDDIYFQISATSCTDYTFIQTDWLWIFRK